MLADYLPAIIKAFQNIERQVHRLCLHITDELAELPIWGDNGAGGFDDQRHKVVFALKNFGFDINLKPQETYQFPGAIAGTRKTLQLVTQGNQAKDDFRKLILEARNALNKDITKNIRSALYYAGYPGICLKQVMRHIQAIDYHPRRIAWTKGRGSSNVILNKKEALERLQKAGQGTHIQIQIEKISRLKNNEYLIKRREIKPHWIINIADFTPKSKHAIRASLPLIYLHHNNKPLPQVCFSQKINRNTKVARADKKADEKPYLSSINAFRRRHKI